MNNAVRKQFDSAASNYHNTASAQRDIATALSQFLPRECAGPILEVGSGTGFLTEILVARYPEAKIDAVDISSQMIATAESRLKTHSICFYVTDIMQFAAKDKYPLIISNAALQWVDPLEDCLSRLRQMLTAEGKLVFSVMISGTLELLYQTRSELFPESPGGLVLLNQADVRGAVVEAGFTLSQSEPQKYFQPIEDGGLFAYLKKIGVTASSSQSKHLSRAQLRQLQDEYERRCLAKYGELGVEYSVLFCSCELEDGLVL